MGGGRFIRCSPLCSSGTEGHRRRVFVGTKWGVNSVHLHVPTMLTWAGAPRTLGRW